MLNNDIVMFFNVLLVIPYIDQEGIVITTIDVGVDGPLLSNSFSMKAIKITCFFKLTAISFYINYKISHFLTRESSHVILLNRDSTKSIQIY